MEGLGKRLQDARIAKGLSLDEAARLTKIRSSRISEIEAEDFSNFASLAYAKGFLQIYGKFLNVDVSSYLDAFEASEGVTVDGYSYLQDNPAPRASRPVAVRKTESRGSFWPLIIGVIVLVAGFSLLKLFLDIRRIKPKSEPTMIGVGPTPTATANAPTTSGTATPPRIVAPRALPVENESPPIVTAATPSAANGLTTSPAFAPVTPRPEVAASTPEIATTAPTEPEVRRAEPVRPEELANLERQGAGTVQHVEIRPLRKTYVKVVLDNDGESRVFEQWISPAEGARQFRGQHVSIRVLDRGDVDIRKNGRPVTRGDADVTVE